MHRPGRPSALQQQAACWLAEGRSTVVVELLATRGSVPREAGTRMLVAADQVLGSIGGGHLEWQALRDARQALAAGTSAGLPRDTTVALGPTLGQCCGGQVSLRWRWLTPEVLADWPAVPPQFHLQLHGAGHVGQALVRLLAGLDCTVQWIDERDNAFGDAPVAAHIQQLASESPAAEVAQAPAGSHFLVMTHRHDLDQRIVEAVLRRDDTAWLGLIGSATKRARFEHRLLERGLTPQQLQRLHCPIGLPGIRGKAPEVIAIAVAAQLLQNAGPTN